MKHKTRTKALSWLLSLAMALSLLPGLSIPAEAYEGDPYAELVNTTSVKFNNMDWYIIADDSTGAREGTLTLLAKEPIERRAFDENGSNVYKDSSIRNYLDRLTAAGGDFAAVAEAIVPTELTDVDVTGAKLYLLSTEEANAILQEIRSGNLYWLLRSKAGESNVAVVYGGGNINSEKGVAPAEPGGVGVRPALKLDLSKVYFSAKKKAFSLHGHSFTYSAEGDTITATCSASGCDLPNNAATLTIVPPEYRVCDSSEKPATIAGDHLLEFDPLPDIVYTKNGEVLDAAPNSEGNYTASITLGGVTAKVDYELIDPCYTITIPATLNIAKAGWNATDGIGATGVLARDKALTVTASSDGEFALVSGGSDTSKVNYKLAGSGDESTTYDSAAEKTYWKFFELSDTEVTEPMGVVVEDYSGKPSGDYTDTVTFTAVVKTKATMQFTQNQFSANEGQVTKQCFKMTGDGEVILVSGNASIADITKPDPDYNLTYIKQGSTTITAKVEDTEEYAYVENEVTCRVTVNEACVTAGTLVTLADGTQAPIETLKPGDMVMTWSFWNGRYEAQPVTLLFNHGVSEYTVLTLTFSDGSAVETINGHGFYNTDINDYAFIEPHNVREYIGGHFVRRAADGSNEIVTLVDASTETREVGCYSLQTAYNENFMTENMLSITMEYVPGRYHYFDIGDNMVYDPDSMARDIAKYGLFTAEEFSDYLAPELFDMFNGAYFKVLVGRGTLTYEDIFRMIEISPIE